MDGVCTGDGVPPPPLFIPTWIDSEPKQAPREVRCRTGPTRPCPAAAAAATNGSPSWAARPQPSSSSSSSSFVRSAPCSALSSGQSTESLSSIPSANYWPRIEGQRGRVWTCYVFFWHIFVERVQVVKATGTGGRPDFDYYHRQSWKEKRQRKVPTLLSSKFCAFVRSVAEEKESQSSAWAVNQCAK